jgi:glycosyltransferase involved in cell wall biosynthesis
MIGDQPLRIALLTYRGRPDSGGQGVYVRHLSRELTALGHQVTVVSGPPHPRLDPGPALTRLPGLELFAEPDPFRTPSLRELRTPADWTEFVGMRRGDFPEPLAFSLRALAHLARQPRRFDLVHDNQCLGYGLLGLAALGLPVLATVHHPLAVDRDLELAAADPERRLGIRRWYRFLGMQRRVARRIERFVTPSDAARQAITQRLGVAGDRIDVTPIGVDHTVFRPGDDPRVPGRIVTTASADVPLKGLTELVAACALLRGHGHRVELVVVGSARRGGPTEAAIARHGLDDGSVSFRTGLSDTELAALLRSAEIACVPSRYEGFSLPAVEAMACGTPLVASSAGALPEVVGQAGILVPAGDPAALAGALGALLDDPELRQALGAAGVRRARRYTWRRCAEATVMSYRKLLAGPASTTAPAVVDEVAQC